MNANEKMKKNPEAAEISLTTCFSGVIFAASRLSLTPCFSGVTNAAGDSLTACFGWAISPAPRLSLTPCFSGVSFAARRLSLTPCFSGVFEAAGYIEPLQRFLRAWWKPLKRFPQSPAGPVTQLKQGVNERAGQRCLVTQLKQGVNERRPFGRVVASGGIGTSESHSSQLLPLLAPMIRQLILLALFTLPCPAFAQGRPPFITNQ